MAHRCRLAYRAEYGRPRSETIACSSVEGGWLTMEYEARVRFTGLTEREVAFLRAQGEVIDLDPGVDPGPGPGLGVSVAVLALLLERGHAQSEAAPRIAS